MKYNISVQDQTFEIEIGSVAGNTAQVTVGQTPYMVTFETPAGLAPTPAAAPARAVAVPSVAAKPVVKAVSGGEVVTAPMPGVILSISVQVGASVSPGQVVAVMEAMKMENNLTCHVSGTVKEILAPKGTELSTGDAVLVIG